MLSHPKRTHHAVVGALTPLLAVLALAACSELPTAAPDEQSPANAPPLAATTAAVNLAGRALAANCFQCHGTDGIAGELKIAGQSASGIIAELNEMRGKNPRENIMNLHALAYTPAEIALIADYISRQGN
jgi:sulfide dehydrogenase cytochrome subunit